MNGLSLANGCGVLFKLCGSTPTPTRTFKGIPSLEEVLDTHELWGDGDGDNDPVSISKDDKSGDNRPPD